MSAVPARALERYALAGLAAWETAALVSGRVPTITQACRRYRRWLVPAAVALLAVHLWAAPDPRLLPLTPG